MFTKFKLLRFYYLKVWTRFYFLLREYMTHTFYRNSHLQTEGRISNTFYLPVVLNMLKEVVNVGLKPPAMNVLFFFFLFCDSLSARTCWRISCIIRWKHRNRAKAVDIMMAFLINSCFVLFEINEWFSSVFAFPPMKECKNNIGWYLFS